MDRTMSVVTARRTTASSSLGWSSSSACSGPSAPPRTFSPPSKHRYIPPATRATGRTAGASQLSSRPTGRMTSSLLRRDPSAILLMIGSSRSGVMPVTYCGVAATSSTAAAETFAVVLTAIEAVSSRVDSVSLASVAMSSRRAKKPDMGLLVGGSASMPMGNERSGIPVGERITSRPAPARRRGRDGVFDSATRTRRAPPGSARSSLNPRARTSSRRARGLSDDLAG